MPRWLATALVLVCASRAEAQVGKDTEVVRRAYWSVSLAGGPIVPRAEEDEGLAFTARVGYTSRLVFGAVGDVRGGMVRREDGDHALFGIAAMPRLTVGSPSMRLWFGLGVGGLFEEGRGGAASVETRAGIDLAFLAQGGLSLGAAWTMSFLGEEQWDYLMFDVGLLLDL